MSLMVWIATVGVVAWSTAQPISFLSQADPENSNKVFKAWRHCHQVGDGAK
jgi:cytochrome c2